MKIPLIISLSALMAMAAARSAAVIGETALDINYADPVVPLGTLPPPVDVDTSSDIVESPSSDMADGDGVEADHNGSRFIAWSSPGYKGHKQVTKNTRGCYILDGGAVGSYEGDSTATYGFFADEHCKTKLLYGWDSAPVNRIDPIIYPKSVKIYQQGYEPPPPQPEPKYTLIAWSQSSFCGDRQLVGGMGCQSLDGSKISSFQGEFKYKFFSDSNCHGRKLLEAQDGQSSVRKMTFETIMRGAKVEKCFSRQELNDRAEFAMVDSTPIRFYIRSAEQLFKQAEIYQAEGDLQTSYILYMRYCNLVVTLLPKHSEYSNPEQKAALSKLKKGAAAAMTEIARFKPILDKRYNEYQEYIKQREKISAQAHGVQGLNPQSQDAQPQFDMQHRKDISKEDKGHQEHQWTNTLPAPGWSLAKALEGVPGTNSSQLTQQTHQYQQHNNSELISEIQYPEYQRHQNHSRSEISTPSIRAQPLIPIPISAPPALPRKPVVNNAPKLPPKIPMDEDVHEFSQGLRTLIVPVRLLDRFLNIVRPNTIKNLETCGILAGVLSRNKLTVTTLIIPKQTATSDTCSTTNEDELFEFQNDRDLMTLGWIHDACDGGGLVELVDLDLEIVDLRKK
ncbi:hypothetical protein BGX26_003553 [Mortierella sp. AD094]|nr:hypothetical protein BGX26_003553 [Mortierella sp. AD094]